MSDNTSSIFEIDDKGVMSIKSYDLCSKVLKDRTHFTSYFPFRASTRIFGVTVVDADDKVTLTRLETLSRNVKQMFFDPMLIMQKYHGTAVDKKLNFINEHIDRIHVNIAPDLIGIHEMTPKLHLN